MNLLKPKSIFNVTLGVVLFFPHAKTRGCIDLLAGYNFAVKDNGSLQVFE